MNSYVELVSTISNTCGDKKRRTLQENPEESCLVPEIGQLSNFVIESFLILATS